MKKVQPAVRIVSFFGGVRATARALNCSPGSIAYWLAPKTRGGAGGRIPSTSHQNILKSAKRLGIRIKPADLVTVYMES